MLRQSLKTLVAEPEALLAAAGIAPTLRGEALTVSDFARLAYILERWPERQTELKAHQYLAPRTHRGPTGARASGARLRGWTSSSARLSSILALTMT